MIREQVSEFHEVANQPILKVPTIPSDDRVRLRLRLIAEEVSEILYSSLSMTEDKFKELKTLLNTLIDTSEVSVDIVELADGLADTDYVVEGTRLEFGINGPPIAAEVHRSNMAKFGDGCRFREDGKILKPPDWTPPDILGELKKQGWKPSLAK